MKMKRFAAALLALILCAAFMTACSPKPEQPAATSGNASSGSAAAEPAATAEPTSAPTSVPPETTAMPEKTDTSVTVTPEKNGLYDALCDLFNNYHEGTAGCSLTGARIAATIMDFSLTNGMDAVRCGGVSRGGCGVSGRWGKVRHAGRISALERDVGSGEARTLFAGAARFSFFA